jgi:mannose-1-phosphate guanylyltransferase / mannose-6-phosphate isomerase
MSRPPIIPLILSGGEGSRLWPLSRDAKPKQFINFGGSSSLFQQTLLRCRASIFDQKPIVVSGELHRFLIAQDLSAVGVKADVILEPLRRDSCAAIAVGCLRALERSSEAMVLVLAADHFIADIAAFVDAVATASIDAEDGYLATFGIKPRFAATGYGYIRPGLSLRDKGCAAVGRFVEKPDAATAEKYIAEGCLWNSGNFLFSAASFIAELDVFQPQVLRAARLSLTLAKRETDFIWLDAKSFETSPQISVDFAVMEKTGKAVVLAVDYEWLDIGSWDAVHALLPKDKDDNVLIGQGSNLDGRNNFIHSAKHFTVVSGLDDLIVVVTEDVVLITKRGQSENVKAIAADYKLRLIEQARSDGR